MDKIAHAAKVSRQVLATLPTGGGKTTVMAELVRRMLTRDKRVWCIVHRIELVEQIVARLAKFGIKAGIIAAGVEPDHDCMVQVCMIQTLVRRSGEILAELLPDYLMVDECHHATAGQYQAVFRACPRAVVVGVTATAERGDRKGLGDSFTALVQVISTLELIEQGYLLRPKYYIGASDLEGLSDRGSEFNEEEVFARAERKPQLYAQVVDNYRKYARGLPGIVFNVNIAHSLKTAEAFCAAGCRAIHVDGDTPPAERKRILVDFAAGKYDILCNVALFTEGFDLPDIGCVILNRPTKSRPLYHQMVGRAARPTAGFDCETAEERLAAIAASPCPRFVVIDHGLNVGRFGFWEQPITYTLDAPKQSKRGTGKLDTTPIKTCPKCGLYAATQARVCEECSYTYPSVVDRAVNGDFVEAEYGKPGKKPKPEPIKKIDLWPAHLRQHYHTPAKLTDAELEQVQRAAGYKRTWIYAQQMRRAQFKKGGYAVR
ncbi:DEAD/DEAH box helicase [Microvirga sp. STS02]|nr:DEAD/DEAH box helicase [Hymenobacter negativus]MBR7207034.1 DEAD/DEAH box helicase [Microvirga sp. STS02]